MRCSIFLSNYIDNKQITASINKFVNDNHNIKDQVVLLLDDIVATGKTLHFVTEHLQ